MNDPKEERRALAVLESERRAKDMINLLTKTLGEDRPLEDRENRAWTAFVRLAFDNPEDAMRDIAASLRAGRVDPYFLKLLADHIDPDVPDTLHGTKFKLARAGRGKPPPEDDLILVDYLYIQMRVFGRKRAAVFRAATERFGVSESTCKTALAEADELARDWPGWATFHKQTAPRFQDGMQILRDRGVQDKALKKHFFLYF